MSNQNDEESVPIVTDEHSEEAMQSEAEEADNSHSSTESSPLVLNGNGKGRCLRVLKSVGRVLLANLLLVLTIASVVVGVIVGLPAREAMNTLSDDSYSLMVRLLSFPGELFIRLLQMLILPLIIFSLIAGLGSLEAKVAGSLGWKTVLYYFTTTMLAIILGIILVVTIKPGGRGTDFECNNSASGSHSGLSTLDSILDLFRYANLKQDTLHERSHVLYIITMRIHVHVHIMCTCTETMLVVLSVLSHRHLLKLSAPPFFFCNECLSYVY